MFSSISFSVFFSSTKITFSFSKYLLPFPSPLFLLSAKKSASPKIFCFLCFSSPLQRIYFPSPLFFSFSDHPNFLLFLFCSPTMTKYFPNIQNPDKKGRDGTVNLVKLSKVYLLHVIQALRVDFHSGQPAKNITWLGLHERSAARRTACAPMFPQKILESVRRHSHLSMKHFFSPVCP